MQITNYQDFAKLQSKGLITIPKKFRQSLKFQENQLLKLRQDKGRLIIEPVRILPYPVRSYSKQNINQFIKLDAQD
ncbi:MAG: AbrB/MazE/SpoVT family DNA-binding domain-containing protein [Patescibacteria group bacterium]|nr:AbrB/MazE/SpoVT family DNA-binding domain-containing protein [Patescibacteria group bacterium]